MLIASGMAACDEESNADSGPSGPAATTGAQSGGGGAGADGGNAVGGAGAAGQGGNAVGGAGATGGGGAGQGGGVGGAPMGSNVNCDAPSGAAGNLKLTPIATGLSGPIGITSAWGDSTRMYVIEQGGRIQLLKGGVVTEFLDISGPVSTSDNERGLLGLAFHPDYLVNGRFFVHYSNDNGNGPGAGEGDTVIEEYRRDPANDDLADPTPVRLIYTTDQPAGNHNGGTIAFSPVDGFLWIGLGDGGGGNDVFGNGQNKNTPLGSLLRLDVDSAQPYAAPAGNITDGLDLIHDWGLRNPYRWSFDACTGARYIGDVGQLCFEEISIAAANAGNLNWGWNSMEGNHCFDPNNANNCSLTPPGDCAAVGEPAAVEIVRSESQTVIGGHVYRGSAIPWLRGTYFYAALYQGTLRTVRWVNGAITEGPTLLTIGGGQMAGFGLDNDGEMYLVKLSGSVHRIEAE